MQIQESTEPILPLRREANSYKPEDSQRWGLQRFMAEVVPKGPLAIPDLGFSADENLRTDTLLKQEGTFF